MNKIKLINLTIDNKGHYGLGASSSPFDKDFPLYLRITDIDDNSYVSYLPTCVDPKQYPDYNNHLLKNNDIVFARTGNSTGRNYFYDGKFKNVVFAGFLIKYSLDPKKVNPKYVSYYCQSQEYKSTIDALSNGSTRKNLNANQFGRIEIPLYSIETQQHIVDTIGSIDDLIDTNNKIIESLSAYCDKLFKKIDYIDFKSYELGELFDIKIGRTPPRAEKEWFNCEPSIKWISISDMCDKFKFIFKTKECLTIRAVSKFNVPIIPKDTLIMSFKLTVGRLGITTEDMLSNEAIAAFNTDNLVLRNYVLFYLSNFDFKSLGNTSSIANAINSKIIKTISIKVPSEIELTYFNDKASLLLDKILNISKQNNTLIKLKEMYLKKFFG